MNTSRESSVQLIQQRLTCPICLDRFKKPKLLPCQHTFCLQPCLVNLIDRSNRRIKCPECRSIHIVPNTGVETYPNNITILGFLDLDFSRSLTNAFLDRCNQCNKKFDNLIKCLDCEKFFCEGCRPSHLGELKNNTIQNILNLRKNIPKLSQKVGQYEKKNEMIVQNQETIKREITSVINRLIEDLKNRERCLHAEAEVCMESQIRTNGLEKENAEIELSSVSTFCDASEQALNKEGQDHHNEIALINKQCKNFTDQLKNIDHQTNEIKRIILSVADLRDFSSFIKKFGCLIEANGNLETNGQNNSHNSLFLDRSQTLTSSNNFSTEGSFNQPRQRQTWDRSNYLTMNNVPLYNYDDEMFLVPPAQLNQSHQNTDRNAPPVPARSFPPPAVTFDINMGNSPRTTNPLRRSEQQPNRVQSPRTQTNSNHPPVEQNLANTTNSIRRSEQQPNRIQSPRTLTNSNNPPAEQNLTNTGNPPGVVRSNTFVIDDNPEPVTEGDQLTRSSDNTELHNVRRSFRARTPMTFNIMLDDYDSQMFEDNSQMTIETPIECPSMPSINYATKTKAKLIVGKQGRENGEFVWPVDVSLNLFNGQILVADSGNHRVQIFESNGKFFKTFGKLGNNNGQLNTVSGLYIDSMSNIFVVDRLNHRLQVFDRYCRFLRSIGLGEGKAAGQLNHPFSCCVNKISEIFVCDKENDRISVFHLSGKFLRAFGKLGSNRGQFDKPYYIHVTRENRVLVSDCSNHRIQIFDTSGNYISSFGSEGSGNGQLKHPRGITTDKEGFILVADSGNFRVQVFRPDNFLYVTHFGSAGSESGKFRGLEGIVVNPKNGDVIVCDKENHRVQIL